MKHTFGEIALLSFYAAECCIFGGAAIVVLWEEVLKKHRDTVFTIFGIGTWALWCCFVIKYFVTR